jgi:hypothetical protein
MFALTYSQKTNRHTLWISNSGESDTDWPGEEDVQKPQCAELLLASLSNHPNIFVSEPAPKPRERRAEELRSEDTKERHYAKLSMV